MTQKGPSSLPFQRSQSQTTMAMASPPPPPLHGRAVESQNTSDPSAPCHVAVDIPNAEAFGGSVLGIFAWGFVIGEPRVLLVVLFVAIVMLCVYGDRSHPIHTRVDKDEVLGVLAMIAYPVELHEQERGRGRNGRRAGGSDKIRA